METNDSNIKPQQTGGLKLMTVFIAVLALHVVVIGGFTVYHLMSGGSTDAELLTDKTHKNVKMGPDGSVIADNPAPETSQVDKSVPPSSDQTASASSESNNTGSTASMASSSEQPTGPMHTGPVINPPVSPTPAPATTTAATTEPATTPAFEPASELGGAPYVVKSHDSLARIARQNHTSVAKLKAANSLTNDMLHIGQKLVIPAHAQAVAATAAPAATSADASGSTTILSSTSTNPSMNIPAATALVPVKHSSAVTSPAVATATASGHHLYTVMKGDTLTKIARKFKTTPAAIMTANSITDPAKLSVGKKLRIPGQEARSATTEAPAAPATEQPAQTQTKPGASAQLANFLQ